MGGLMLALDAVVAEYYVGPYSYSEGFAVSLLRPSICKIKKNISILWLHTAAFIESLAKS